MMKLSKFERVSRLHVLQGGKCHWCGNDAPLDRTGTTLQNRATLDHIYTAIDPRRKVGDETCVMACFLCNSKRGMLSVDEWLRVVRPTPVDALFDFSAFTKGVPA